MYALRVAYALQAVTNVGGVRALQPWTNLYAAGATLKDGLEPSAAVQEADAARRAASAEQGRELAAAASTRRGLIPARLQPRPSAYWRVDGVADMLVQTRQGMTVVTQLVTQRPSTLNGASLPITFRGGGAPLDRLPDELVEERLHSDRTRWALGEERVTRQLAAALDGLTVEQRQAYLTHLVTTRSDDASCARPSVTPTSPDWLVPTW